MKLPVQTQTVDMRTGKVTKTETAYAEIMPARPGTCPQCGRIHPEAQPHDQQSLLYQYQFYAREGRWPTWADAMAHCPDDVRQAWTQALADKGISVDGGAS